MKYETKISNIIIHDNGIIHVITKPNVTAEAEDLEESLKIFNNYLKGEKGLFLIEFIPNGVSTAEARKRFTEPKRKDLKKAEAIIVNSLPHRIDVNHYISFHKPEHPVKLFEDKKRAMEWLLTFKNQ